MENTGLTPPPHSCTTPMQVSAISEDGSALFPVDIQNLLTNENAPCDLFHYLETKGYVLFAGKGVPFPREVKNRLLSHGVRELWIREAETDHYFDYIKKNLTALVRNPSADAMQKAQAVHSACREIMKKVYDDPRACFIQRAQDIVIPTVDLISSNNNATKCLIQITAHDSCTYTHSTNVGIFGMALTRLLHKQGQLPENHEYAMGFFLHDLGKCHVSQDILNKPGSLDAEEWKTIKAHPESGGKILRDCGCDLEIVQTMTIQHHERDDGSGYPLGLKREEIHPLARICRLTDVYEALTADRPYQRRRTTFEALKLMKQTAVSDLDQNLFESFLKVFAT